jgi:antitoxin VapB
MSPLAQCGFPRLPGADGRQIYQAYAGDRPTGERRHVALFRNGRNQAVRIPVEFELPGDEAIMLDEDFPEIEDPVAAPERVL